MALVLLCDLFSIDAARVKAGERSGKRMRWYGPGLFAYERKINQLGRYFKRDLGSGTEYSLAKRKKNETGQEFWRGFCK